MSRIFPRIVRGRPESLRQVLGVGSLDGATLDDVTDPDFGAPVIRHRTSWVRLGKGPKTDFYVKTYDYPSAWDRWRAAVRWTGPLRPSRAAREFDALAWLRHRNLGFVEPIGAVEWRRSGMLHRASLLTEAWPGSPLDRLLPTLPEPAALAVAHALGHYVGSLHRAGFCDGNLDLRNLLARTADDGTWQISKIDSPRWRVPRGQRQARAWANRDWQRLLPQLGSDSLANAVRQGATARA